MDLLGTSSENWYQFQNNNLLVNVSLPLDTIKQKKQEIIFVVDKSLSMSSCNAIEQVVQSIQYMTSKNSIEPTFIVYDEIAYEVTGEALASTVKAGGCTCFEAAFRALAHCISKEKFGGGSAVHVVFMTDGEDNRSNNLQKAILDFQNSAQQKKLTTTIHTIGFRPQHNFDFLEEIRKKGDVHGVYRYAGDFELEDKFAELFDFLDESLSTKLSVEMHEIQSNGFYDYERQIVSFNVLIQTSNELSSLCMQKVSLQVNVLGQKVELHNKPPNNLFSIHVVDSIDILCQDDLIRAQNMLSEVNCFSSPREIRQKALEMRKAVQDKLNKYFSTFADIARKSVNPQTLTHQLNSLRYETQFSKTRRQRTMDKRAISNSNNGLDIKEGLSKLSPNLSLFQDMDLICTLTGDSIGEMMEMSNSDFMVFTLQVGRPEHIIEAPTNIEVSKFLVGTYSFEAFQATSRFMIDKDGGIAAHGGFSGAPKQEDGYSGLFKGPDGECMNAALPLYINEDHFERVRVQLKPTLGYFFTLDPLGFKGDQYLALYSILGHMNVQKAAGTFSSDWADWLITNFTKMCTALYPTIMNYLQSGQYTLRVRGDLFEEFIKSPKWRLKVYTPNLLTVVGWYLMLKSSGSKKMEEKHIGQKYMVALTEEAWRRACRGYYKVPHRNGESVFSLKHLLYGPIKLNDSNAIPSPILGKVDKAKSKEFSEWTKLNWGLFGKKKTENMSKKYGNEGPDIGFPLLKVEDYEDFTGHRSPKIASYSEHACFFDSLFQSEMEKMAPRLQYLNQIHRSWLSGKNLSGEEKRVILLQALQHMNRKNCEDSDEGAYLNTYDFLYGNLQNQQEKLFLEAHKTFEKKRQEKVAQCVQETNEHLIAKSILLTEQMLDFSGRLMKSCPTRGGGVFDKAVSMLSTGNIDGKPIPLLIEKISVILTGKIKEGMNTHNVISRGESWVQCPRYLVEAYQQLIGTDEFMKIELQMHGRSGWVYRESDIPNRHGHCNSNPNLDLVCVFKGFKFVPSFKSKTDI